jgi:hypothetical protein
MRYFPLFSISSALIFPEWRASPAVFFPNKWQYELKRLFLYIAPEI